VSVFFLAAGTATYNNGVSMPPTNTSALPAHRPSRRDEIIDAAISVFAVQGFVDASIAQVAQTAGVAVTAVYYHFASKQELYEAALSRVFRTVDDIVAAVRPDNTAPEGDTLDRTIDAVWDWVDANPEPATLVALHTPAGTRRAAELRHEFDELHVRRAFAYINDSGTHTPTQGLEAGITVRVLVDLLIVIHAMRVAGGPLHSFRPNELRKTVKQVSARLLDTSR
jgi:AcrR family transcriptional regulator